jgi:hypothetical protein
MRSLPYRYIFVYSFPVQNGLKQGDALTQTFFNSAVGYVLRQVQENLEELKLNGIYQLLAYADDVNLLDGNKLYKETQWNFNLYQ